MIGCLFSFGGSGRDKSKYRDCDRKRKSREEAEREGRACATSVVKFLSLILSFFSAVLDLYMLQLLLL